MSLTVMDPTWQPSASAQRRLAPRPQRTEGLRLGVLCNGLGNSTVFFDELVVQLMERGKFDSHVKVVKDSKSVPPTDEQWQQIRTADVVVTGFGGCGSCSTRSVRDALELEWSGIPAVYVGHQALQPAVAAISEISGHADYPQVLGDLNPPVAAWEDEAARELARQLAPAVFRRIFDESALEDLALRLGREPVGTTSGAAS